MSNQSQSTIDDVWSSLQDEESKKRNEYKTRYETIQKKSSERYGKEFNLVELMKKVEISDQKKKSTGTSNKKVTKKKEIVNNHHDHHDHNSKIDDKDITESEDNDSNKVLISLSELSNRIGRHVIGLDSSEASIRRKSITILTEEIFIKYRLSPQDYSLLFHDICKSVFRLYADSIEKCRELSMQLTLLFFKNMIDVVPVLRFFFTALMQRLPSNIGYDEDLQIFVYDKENHDAYRRGKAVDRQDKVNPSEATIIPFTFTESSEEIRLLSYQVLEKLLSQMISLHALTILQPYFHEMIMYLQIGLRDPYPNIKLLVLETLENISKQGQEFELGLKFYAVALIRAILPILRHRHAKVRAAAIYCITAYFMVPDKAKRKGAGTDAIVDLIGFHEENVLQISSFYKPQVQINYLAELVMDNTFQVREATIKMLDVLLSELPDRYDHTSRLLPYLLDFLTDDNQDELVNIALTCLIKCGKTYEEEHQDEIIERRQYGVDGDYRMNLTKQLPYPFHSQRPRLGIRLFVKGHIKRFLHVLIKELSNWKSSTRLKSVKLLKVAVILSEESVTIESASIFPALLKAMHYTKYEEIDWIVYKVLLEVTELLGRYIHPDVYLHYLLPRLRGDVEVIGGMGVDTNTRVLVMEFIGSLIHGTKPVEIVTYIHDIISCLCDEYIISRESITLQSAALELMITILGILQDVSGDIDRDSYTKLYGTSYEFLLWNLISSTSSSSSFVIGTIYSSNHMIISHDKVVEALTLLSKLTSDTHHLDSVKNLFVKFGNDLLVTYLNREVDGDWTEVLPIISCLIDGPYHIPHQNVAIFDLVLTF